MVVRKDFVWWFKGKKGSDGMSKNNDGFHKGGFRPYQPDKGAGKDYTQNKGKGKDQKGKGKEGTYAQSGLSASETLNEEGYGHARESDDGSISHWTDDSWTSAAGYSMDGISPFEPCQPSNTRCFGPWLHTVDRIEIGNRKIQEACMV